MISHNLVLICSCMLVHSAHAAQENKAEGPGAIMAEGSGNESQWWANASEANATEAVGRIDEAINVTNLAGLHCSIVSL